MTMYFLASVLFCPIVFINADYLPFQPEFSEDIPDFLEDKPDVPMDIHDDLPAYSDTKVLKVRMQNAVSPRHDGHVCSGQRLDVRDAFITRFVPVTPQHQAHHMLIVGCEEPYSDEPNWDCEDQDYCNGPSTLIYVWALNGTARSMPPDVGFHIGGTTGIRSVVLGMHYKDKFKDGQTDCSGYDIYVTRQRLPYQAGFYMIAGFGAIPPMVKEYHVDIECQYKGKEMLHPFMFRTHSHNLGYVTAGYRIRNGKWTMIGKMSPQLPQSFYDIASPGMTIRPGDIVAGRCTMRSKRRYWTWMGSTNKDEMCNFYIMYYKRTTDEFVSALDCFDHHKHLRLEERFRNVPDDISSPTGLPSFEMNEDPYVNDKQ